MANSSAEFMSLLHRALAGSDSATRIFISTYGPHILRVVRRKLNPRLRAKFDSLDFVQDVWGSFFAAPPENRTFNHPEELAAYLCRMAANKVVDAVRKRLQGKKYNVNRERHLESMQDPNNSKAEGGVIPLDPGVTPSYQLMCEEEWQKLLKRQPLLYRKVLLGYRDGKTPEVIAEMVGISDRHVRRILEKLLPG